jgi:hypothetical protein
MITINNIDRFILRVRTGWNQKIGVFVTMGAYISLPEIAILNFFPHLALPSAVLWVMSYCILITLSYFLGKREEKVERELNGKKDTGQENKT